MDKLPYPLTLTIARYSGVYEGGKWCAFRCHPEDIPEESHGDDGECALWWAINNDRVGLGEDMISAISDLEHKLKVFPLSYIPFGTKFATMEESGE